MRINKGYWLYFGVVFLCPLFLEFSLSHPKPDTEKQYQINNELKSLLAKMIYIEGDTFTMGVVRSHEIRTTANDSTLFRPGVPKRTIVESFYINATEITNGTTQ